MDGLAAAGSDARAAGSERYTRACSTASPHRAHGGASLRLRQIAAVRGAHWLAGELEAVARSRSPLPADIPLVLLRRRRPAVRREVETPGAAVSTLPCAIFRGLLASYLDGSDTGGSRPIDRVHGTLLKNPRSKIRDPRGRRRGPILEPLTYPVYGICDPTPPHAVAANNAVAATPRQESSENFNRAERHWGVGISVTTSPGTGASTPRA